MAWRERGRFPCFRGDLSEKTKLMAPKSSKSRSKSSSRAEKSEGDASAAQVEPVAADATATNEDEVKSRSRGRSSSRATKNSSSGSDILQTSLPASAASAHHGPHYEFGGPVGAFFTVVSLPIVIYALHFICNADHCLNFTGSASQSLQRTWASMRSYSYWPSHEGLSIFLGWMLLQLLMQLLLPGETVQGCPVQDTRPAARPQGQASLRTFTLPYTLSGHLQFWLSLALVLCSVPSFVRTSAAGASPTWGLSALSPLPLHLLYDHYLSLAGTACIFSALLSIYLYASSFSAGADGKGQVLAKGGNTGSAVYDFFIGRELNPRIGPLDLKCFCELRPGLIGWLVINLGMAAKQFQRAAAASPSHTGSVSLSMLLLVASQGFYVWDALYNERAILSTMDITTDGFGYMLAFGDLAWVPFIYSLQARYLVDRDPALSSAALVAILALQLCGYAIFRLANGQKDAFRRDPEGDDVKHLRYLQTKRGTRLIVSGWWGAARKINYTGDYLVTLSWCLLCGFDSPIPYFQAIYFAILLVHRADRDDALCADKYGADWETYKAMVPYRFIPGVW